MKIKIESDAFDIVNRLKEIDDGYFLLFNLDNGKYELHYKYQPNTYCLTYPYENLDNRLLELIYKTNVSNIDNIIEDIDNNNTIIENNVNNDVKDRCDYMLREIYDFSKISSKNFDEAKAFSFLWR